MHASMVIRTPCVAMCDDGATVSCNRSRIGAIPGTFRPSAGALTIGAASGALVSTGTDLCAVTLVDVHGVEHDVLRRMHRTPGLVADIVLSEAIEVFKHQTSFIFNATGRTMLASDGTELVMGFSPNGLGWLGVKALTDRARFEDLRVRSQELFAHSQLIHAIADM